MSLTSTTAQLDADVDTNSNARKLQASRRANAVLTDRAQYSNEIDRDLPGEETLDEDDDFLDHEESEQEIP